MTGKDRSAMMDFLRHAARLYAAAGLEDDVARTGLARLANRIGAAGVGSYTGPTAEEWSPRAAGAAYDLFNDLGPSYAAVAGEPSRAWLASAHVLDSVLRVAGELDIDMGAFRERVENPQFLEALERGMDALDVVTEPVVVDEVALLQRWADGMECSWQQIMRSLGWPVTPDTSDAWLRLPDVVHALPDTEFRLWTYMLSAARRGGPLDGHLVDANDAPLSQAAMARAMDKQPIYICKYAAALAEKGLAQKVDFGGKPCWRICMEPVVPEVGVDVGEPVNADDLPAAILSLGPEGLKVEPVAGEEDLEKAQLDAQGEGDDNPEVPLEDVTGFEELPDARFLAEEDLKAIADTAPDEPRPF